MNTPVKQQRMSRCSRIVILITIVVLIIVVGIVMALSVRSNEEMRSILEESVKSQLISISVAAREILDIDAFDRYNSLEDVAADQAAYDETLRQLRQLASNVDAKYIYALKQIGDAYYFVFDTDTEITDIFIPYDLSPVHEQAFAGNTSADVLNVVDEYGSFNTGAVPIIKDGKLIGIISTDIEDIYLKQATDATRRNTIILICTLAITMLIILALVIYLLRRVKKMQDRLKHMAHYDIITGLPNRQYLLEFLDGITKDKKSPPFALLFIDLDNFKLVNDSVGHEAGDELLQHIAEYLQKSDHNAMAFRPSAGRLNIAARIGGDEFVQVAFGISTIEEAGQYARRLLDGFTSTGIDRYIEKYAVGLSIGVAMYPYHSENYHTLIKYADVAMYYAKRAGKNGYRIYEDEMGRYSELNEDSLQDG